LALSTLASSGGGKRRIEVKLVETPVIGYNTSKMFAVTYLEEENCLPL
jgi:hypothetical protein